METKGLGKFLAAHNHSREAIAAYNATLDELWAREKGFTPEYITVYYYPGAGWYVTIWGDRANGVSEKISL